MVTLIVIIIIIMRARSNSYTMGTSGNVAGAFS